MNKLRFDIGKSVLKRGVFKKLPIIDPLIEPETQLWRSVLDQALSDLIKGESHFHEEPQEYQELIEWFDESNEDFISVSQLAQLGPKIVYYKMTQILDEIIDVEKVYEGITLSIKKTMRKLKNDQEYTGREIKEILQEILQEILEEIK